MATTFEDHLALDKPAKGDLDWDDEINGNFDAIGQALAPYRVYKVSPDYTSTNLGNGSATDRRHFDTIQGAITAAESAFADAVIEVMPGVYNENLTVTKSVSIIGRTKPASFHGGPNQVTVRGSDTTRSPIITVTPPDGTAISMTVANLVMENRYNQTAASESTTPYLVDLQNHPTPTYAGSANVFGFLDCIVKCETWGQDNKWAYGFKADGYWNLAIQRVTMGAYCYGGGTEGYVKSLFYLRGDSANSKTLTATFKECYLTNTVPTTDPGNVCLFNIDDEITCRVHRTSMGGADMDQGAALIKGATGTIQTDGLEGGEPPLQANQFSEDWTGF